MYNYCIVRLYETLKHVFGIILLQSNALRAKSVTQGHFFGCFTRPSPEESLFTQRRIHTVLILPTICTLAENTALLWAKHTLLILALSDLNNARENTYALKHTESLYGFRHTGSFLINKQYRLITVCLSLVCGPNFPLPFQKSSH